MNKCVNCGKPWDDHIDILHHNALRGVLISVCPTSFYRARECEHDAIRGALGDASRCAHCGLILRPIPENCR